MYIQQTRELKHVKPKLTYMEGDKRQIHNNKWRLHYHSLNN
jgi:hypothetical protein